MMIITIVKYSECSNIYVILYQADLTVHPPPQKKTVEGGFIFFV